MTKKLYDLDSHRRDFSATVLRCDADGERYAVVLDQTLFFPEGGGQPADTGVLGGARVLGVQITPEAIVHYTDAPLTPGAQVRGEIDWPQRFRRMQGHSGEHIISGLIHSEYGFDNVGFHLGEDTITMDYNGELTWPQLMHIEQLANEAVYRNVPIRTEYPSPARLAQMTYRSKLDLTEDVRIVTVEGYDVCACCAPHVSCTGEIGAIKFTSVMRHRGGIRVTILCGSDAETDYREKSAQIAALSAQLSVRQSDVVPAVQRLLDEIQQPRQLNLQRRFSIHQFHGAVQQIADIVNAAPYFRHAAVYAEESVNSFHCGTNGILCREDGISWCLSELSEECEVYTAIRNNIRSVTLCSRHKECCDIRHHGRYTNCTVLSHVFNLVNRNAKMIEPLFCDFLTCTLLHRLLDIITRYICKQTIYPYTNLVFVLILELSLSVDRPA